MPHHIVMFVTSTRYVCYDILPSSPSTHVMPLRHCLPSCKQLALVPEHVPPPHLPCIFSSDVPMQNPNESLNPRACHAPPTALWLACRRVLPTCPVHTVHFPAWPMHMYRHLRLSVTTTSFDPSTSTYQLCHPTSHVYLHHMYP
jgi:hypothetical protein